MKKFSIFTVASLCMALSSCNDYLDINNDPASPDQDVLTTSIIFPGAEMAFANSYGDYLRITGGYFSQQYAQMFGTSNYLDYSKFAQSAVRSNSCYANLATRCLQNISTVMAMAKGDEEWGTYLAATVIRVAAYQSFVDCYGEIPYTEALDMQNLSPKFDEGKDIYAGLIAELDEALSKVNGSETVCTNVLLPGERASEWIKVANALKLRLLMRESNAVDVKSQLQKLVAENNFPTSDVEWSGCWQNSSGQANPYYQEEFATYFGSTQQNVVLNLALYATMSASDDPRLETFFSPNASGNYTGGVSGSNFSTTSSYKANYWCRPAMTYDAPVSLISVAEIEFFLAEYEARYGSASSAKSHYENAIKASFTSAGISDDPTSTVLNAYPWDASNYKKCIGIQKWVALSGVNNFEAWCELRRLGYPAMGSVTGPQLYDENNDDYDPSLLVPGTLYTPIKVASAVGANNVLQRWPYPESVTSRNSKSPSYKGDMTPVFWAK